MTAKQKLQSHIDAFGLSDTHEERLWDDINQYALHIAEQAVKDAKRSIRLGAWDFDDVPTKILTRINELTQGE